MAQIVLTLGGAAIGSAGGPVGMQAGAVVGAIAGKFIDALWMSDPHTRQPSVLDTSVQAASYGKPITNAYGTMRLTGELIWSGGILAHTTTTTGSAGFGTGMEVDTTTYTGSFAVGICAGPISGIRRLWADKKLLVNFARGSYIYHLRGGTLHIYHGDENQMPPAAMQESRGVENVPGFRGLAIVLIRNMTLTDFANHIPQIEAEVVVPAGTPAPQSALVVQNMPRRKGFVADMLDAARHVYWSVANSSPPTFGLAKVDGLTGTIVANNPLIPVDTNMDGQGMYSLGTNGDVYVNSYIVDSIPGSAYRAIYYRVDQNTLQIKAATTSAHPVWLPGFARNRYGFIITSDPGLGAADSNPFVNVIDESTLAVVVASTPMPGRGMADMDASYNVWYFAQLDDGSSATGPAMIYQYTFTLAPVGSGSSQPLGQTLVEVGSWDVTSAFTQAPQIHPPGNGMACMFLPDQNALLLSVDGKTLVKWDIATHSVTGAENDFGHNGVFWGLVGSNGTWQQGETSGQVAFPRGLGAIIVDTVGWELVQDVTYASYIALSGMSGDGVQYDEGNGWLYVTLTGGSSIMQDGFARLDLARVDPSYTTLGAVVSDVCERAGYDSSELDVSQLTDQVRGYAIARPTDATACLTPLQDGYFFDAVESDGKLKFIKRGAAPSVTVTKDQMGAYESTSERPDPLEIGDAPPEDLPLLVEVSYIDEGLSYDRGLQLSRRIASNGIVLPTPSRTKRPVDLPVVFLPAEAKAIADTTLVSDWYSRQNYKFSLSRQYLALDPSDVIEVNKDGVNYPMRVTQTDIGANGLIQVQALADEPRIYTPNVIGINATGRGDYGDSGILTSVDTQPISPSMLELFDTPALNDNDARSAGFYMVGGPTLPDRAWNGEWVLRSIDGGASFEPFDSIESSAAIGFATTVLPVPSAWATWDTTSSVTVSMITGADQLVSASNELAVLNGANLALLGGELVQFSTVVANTDGTYTLGGGMTRARRGTDPWLATHAVGELFVLLDASLVVSITEDTGAIGLLRQYEGATFGDTVPTAGPTAFAEQGNRLKPYAVGHITGTRDGSANLAVNWIRRTRSGGDNSWQDGVVEVPLAETSESYSVDIVDGSGVVKRTLSATTTTVSYTAAQQTTDFGSAQSAVSVRIYQISSLVGRGFAASATV